MKKANVYSLRPRPRKFHSLSMIDEETGMSVEMTFRELRNLDTVNIESLVMEYSQRYVTGTGPLNAHGEIRQDSPAYEPPRQLPPLNGEVLVITETAVRIICTLMYLQEGYGGPPTEFYSFEEIVLMMAGSPQFSSELNEMYQKLWLSMIENNGVVKGENPTKTLEPASTDTPSKSCDSTPNTSGDTSPFSTPSTIDSEQLSVF